MSTWEVLELGAAYAKSGLFAFRVPESALYETAGGSYHFPTVGHLRVANPPDTSLATRLYSRFAIRRVSEWLAASLEMKCPVRGCGFESRALRLRGLVPAIDKKRRSPTPWSDLRRFFI